MSPKPAGRWARPFFLALALIAFAKGMLEEVRVFGRVRARLRGPGAVPAGVTVVVLFAVGGASADVSGFTVALGIGVVVALNYSVAVAGAAVLVTSCVFAVFGGPQAAAMALFGVTLPLLNACFDWVSWIISRKLMKRARDSRSVWPIVGDIVLDALWAAVLLILLILALPATVEFLEFVYGGEVVDWREFAVLARNDPWGKGALVSSMAVTTLIPTALHILLGLAAILAHLRTGRRLADYIGTVGDSNMRANWAAVWLLGQLGAAVVILCVLGGGVWLAAPTPFRELLYAPIAWLYGLPAV